MRVCGEVGTHSHNFINMPYDPETPLLDSPAEQVSTTYELKCEVTNSRLLATILRLECIFYSILSYYKILSMPLDDVLTILLFIFLILLSVAIIGYMIFGPRGAIVEWFVISIVMIMTYHFIVWSIE